MAEQNRDQVAELSGQLKALEGESQRLLDALRWSSFVRNVLLLCLLAFVAVFGYLYYRMYQDIQQNKLAQIQEEFVARQNELIEPITLEVRTLAEEVTPDVVKAVQVRIETDGQKYVAAFNEQRDALNQSLQVHVEDAATKLFEKLLEGHEKILKEEFPEINNEAAQTKLHDNMAKTYKQLVQTYYVDYFHNEIEKMALAIDQFPVAEPDETKGPLAQQVLYELMEMIQMMMVGPSDDLNLNAGRESFSAPANNSTGNGAEAPNTTSSGGSN